MRIGIDDLMATKTTPGGSVVLAHREATVVAAIDHIRQNRPEVIVETGTQSSMLVHAHGISTLLFAALAKEVGSEFFSVDISEGKIEEGKSYLAHQFLMKKPVELLHDGYQRMYVRRGSA